MATITTHQAVSDSLVGRPITVEDGRAVVELETTVEMRADKHGLVHGGFVYGAADYAAMLAVNEPTVVLAASDVSYPAPTRVGDVVRAAATLSGGEETRRRVQCTGTVGSDTVVLDGTFECVVPDRHVLE